jgi:hypothetical protein
MNQITACWPASTPATASIPRRRLEVGMALINDYFRGMLGTIRRHQALRLRPRARQPDRQEFGSTKMIRFPAAPAPSPTWRGVTDISGTAS